MSTDENAEKAAREYASDVRNNKAWANTYHEELIKTFLAGVEWTQEHEVGALKKKLSQHSEALKFSFERESNLKEQVRVLREALNIPECACSVPDKLSGHTTGCWMPEFLEAIGKLKASEASDG